MIIHPLLHVFHALRENIQVRVLRGVQLALRENIHFKVGQNVKIVQPGIIPMQVLPNVLNAPRVNIVQAADVRHVKIAAQGIIPMQALQAALLVQIGTLNAQNATLPAVRHVTADIMLAEADAIKTLIVATNTIA